MTSPLSIGEGFSYPMAKTITTVIEISDTHVKLFQSKEIQGKPTISACDIRPIKNYTDEEIVRVLLDLSRSKNISPDSLIVAVARRFTILKQMKLPSQNEIELKKMIELQLVSQIPYPVEDVVYDYSPLEKDASGYTQLLITVAHKDIARRYLKILNTVGINSGKLTLGSLGIWGWLNYQEKYKKIDPNQSIVVINIDLGQSEICFCHNKKMLFSRSINFGARDLNGDSVLAIYKQIELSLSTYQKENFGPDVKKVILLSGPQETLILRDRIERELSLPVEIWSPLDNVVCQKYVAVGDLKEIPVGALTVGFGLLFSDSKKLMNLTPQEIHNTQKNKQRKIQWIQFSVLLGLTLIFVFLIWGGELYQKINHLNSIKAKIDQTKPLFKEAERKIQFVKVLTDELNNGIFVPDLINDLYKLAPEDISLRSLNLDERGTFSIQGYALTRSGLNTFQANLVQSPRLKEVNLQFSTERKIFNMDVIDFQINSQLKK